MSCTIVLWHVDVAVSVWISFCGTCNLSDMFGPHVQKKNLRQVSSKLMWKSISFCTGLSNLVFFYFFLQLNWWKKSCTIYNSQHLATEAKWTCQASVPDLPHVLKHVASLRELVSRVLALPPDAQKLGLRREKPSELIPSLCFTSWWICFGGDEKKMNFFYHGIHHQWRHHSAFWGVVEFIWIWDSMNSIRCPVWRLCFHWVEATCLVLFCAVLGGLEVSTTLKCKHLRLDLWRWDCSPPHQKHR